MEKQLASILIGPVVRDGIAFLRVFLDVGYHAFETAVVADHFEGAVRSDFRDRVDVVASEEDAKVDELSARKERALAMTLMGRAGFLLDFYPLPIQQVHDLDEFREWVLCAVR